MTVYICSICCENFNNLEYVHKTPCNHLYHIECLEEWRNTENSNNCTINTCPNCRSPFTDVENILYQSKEQIEHVRKIINRIHNDPEAQKIINTLLNYNKKRDNPLDFDI